MNTREQFEAAWRKEYPLHSSTAFTRSGFDPERYANTRVQDGWLMWQAAILQAATRDAPSADAVDAQRYQWLRNRENSLETRQYNKEIINGLSCYHDVEGISELKWGVELDSAIDKAIAAIAPKGDGND